jgi:ABC-type uncharacterized transport system YnjBCD permease subunit
MVDVREIDGVERRRPRWRWVEEVDRDDQPKYKLSALLSNLALLLSVVVLVNLTWAGSSGYQVTSQWGVNGTHLFLLRKAQQDRVASSMHHMALGCVSSAWAFPRPD